MSLFTPKPKTAQQKAQMALTRVFIRLLCCGFLVYYVIIPLIQPAYEGDTMNPALRVFFVVLFIVITVFFITVTLIELIRNWKAGYYKAEAHTDDPGVGGARYTSANAPEAEEAEDDEYDDDDDEYEDDEDDEQ